MSAYCYIILDEDCFIRTADSSFYTLMNYQNRDIAGERFLTLLHPDYYEFFVDNFKEYKGRECNLLIKDGEGYYKYVEADLAEKYNEDGCFFCGIQLKDVSCDSIFPSLLGEPDRFSYFMNNINDIYYRADRWGNIVLSSPSCERISGFTLKEIIGMNLAKDIYLQEEKRELLLLEIKEKGFIESSESVLRHKDGSTWWSSVSAHAVYNKYKEFDGVEGIVRDVTIVRKRYFDKISEGEEKYRILFESAIDAFFVINAETGLITDVNKQASGLMGLPGNLIKGQHYSIIHSQHGFENFRRTMEMVLGAKGDEVIGIHYINNINGPVPVEFRGKHIKTQNEDVIIAIFRNISEKLKADALLQESETVYRQITENLFPDGLLYILDDEIIEVNESFCRVWGYQKNEVLGRKIDEFILPEYLDKVIQYIKKGVNSTVEAVAFHKSGKLMPIEATITYIKKDSADVMIAALRNIENIKQQERLVAHRARLAVMGEMVSNIAHQWRQPLSALAGILVNIKARKDMDMLSNDDLENLISDGNELIRYMSHTINDFRNFFSPEKEEEVFSIEKEILKVLKMIDASLNIKDIKVKLNVDEDVMIKGFPTEYAQVIMNILNNAKDVFIDRKTVSPEIVLNIGRNENHKSVVTISDNAGGIYASPLDIIFEPYYTSKIEGDNMGIGLYMSKIIIEKNMGGKFSVENGENGAVFKIII